MITKLATMLAILTIGGALDMAALETVISSRRDRPGSSLRVGADILTPEVAGTSKT